MHAVTQKKYQSHWGSKSHSGDVYRLMQELIYDHCLKPNIVETDPLLAEKLGRAVMQAFCDHWELMERPGYDTEIFHEVVNEYGDILKAAHSQLTTDQVSTILSFYWNAFVLLSVATASTNPMTERVYLKIPSRR